MRIVDLLRKESIMLNGEPKTKNLGCRQMHKPTSCNNGKGTLSSRIKSRHIRRLDIQMEDHLLCF